MMTIENLFAAIIYLGGGVLLSSVTLFLTLAMLLFVWRTFLGIIQSLGIRTSKSIHMKPLFIHDSTNYMQSSPPRVD
ncbi:MAG: hypothetical protein ACPGYT_05460 [Nitrospirales bacterium]